MMKKKRIWLIIASTSLILLLVVFVGSCRNQKNKELPPEDKETAATTEKTVQEQKNDSDKEIVSKDDNITGTASETDDDATSPITPQSEHKHKWEHYTETINHKEEGHYEKVIVQEAWEEEVPKYKPTPVPVCNVCGEIIDLKIEKAWEHGEKHALAGEGAGGHHTEVRDMPDGTTTVKHPATYKEVWVVDKEAYTETKEGYRCKCGAKKE